MTFAILGPLEVRRDGRPVEIPGHRVRTLLSLLILDAGRTVPFETLTAGIWDDRPPGAVGNALQALVSRLRAALAAGGNNPVRQLVVADPSGYRLCAGPEQVDARRFAVLAAEGRAALAAGDAETAAGTLREALALWRGPGELGDIPVVAPEITRLAGLRLAATEDRVEADLRLGRHAEVLAELPALLAGHPLRERLHGQHMRALYGTGRQVEALAAYEQARAIFAEELGADPSPELAELHLSMLRREPAPAKGNLRARLTSFVGREEDVARTTTLLERHRLVTLLGAGGAGKTRLAVESAALMDGPAGGAWLAELAPTSDAAGVTQAVVNALDVRDNLPSPIGGSLPQDPVDRLVRALAGRRLLLVLDNCEHVVEHAARLVDRILADCPGVRVLATSREPLGITGEITWTLPPLALPPAGADPRELTASPAVRLFADRAAAARPGYQVEGEAAAVARICRELDGMPLAIELAAARLRSLSTQQIADRLNDRFRLLTGGSRTALPRHQTLRAVVEWSWDLLEEDERALARRLAAFSDGATLAAAERVCSLAALPDTEARELAPADVLDVLARLVDKSLVVFDAGRYRMLDTIRAYATERLSEAAEDQVVRHAHALYFTELAEAADPGLRRGEQLGVLAAMAAEHDNLSSALRWATDTRATDLALRLVGALGWYWWLRGNRLEGAARTHEVLTTTDPGADSARVALAQAVYAITAIGAALPNDDAIASLERARQATVSLGALLAGEPGADRHPLVAIARPMLVLFGGEQALDGEVFPEEMLTHADPWVVAAGHLFRSLMDYNDGLIGESERAALAAAEGFRAVGDRWGIGTSLSTLADAYFLRGESKQAIEVMREALGVIEDLGSLEDTPYLRARLALGLDLAGHREEAEGILREIAEIVTGTGDRIGEAGVIGARGEFARHDGDLAEARRLYAEAVGLLEDTTGVPSHMLCALNSSLGLLAVQEGDPEQARPLILLAMDQALETKDSQLIGAMLIACAAVCLAEGRAGEAATLLGGAETFRGVAVVVEWDHVRATEAALSALGPGEFARHLDAGRHLTCPEVLALARAQLGQAPA
ncbi:BTAD domain-containing putative transcriptional regulator [Nonomuraea sp. NPDC046570]|uniref:BTAD domain-containing putative transcriptional regulator n=1 Tax=Nonomuraea sp. NPDC046570 TaxID=3155255 RepID=UPI00340678CB